MKRRELFGALPAFLASIGLVRSVEAVEESTDKSYTGNDGIFYSVGDDGCEVGVKDGHVRYKKTKVIETWFDEQGRLHQDGGPAKIVKNDDGTFDFYWYQHGLLHREDGPALNFRSGKMAVHYLNDCYCGLTEFNRRIAEKDFTASLSMEQHIHKVLELTADMYKLTPAAYQHYTRDGEFYILHDYGFRRTDEV